MKSKKNNKDNTDNFFVLLIGIIKKIINILISQVNRIIQKNEVCFIKEKDKLIYSLKDKKLYFDENKVKSIKKYILTDSLIELKVIKVPVVDKNILKNIVLNTIKKHSTIMPNEDNIDYTILNKEEKQYEILVFIKHFENQKDFVNKKLYSTCHIINNLIKHSDLPENSSIITNNDDIWFLYTYKDKKFIKRDIYYKEDLKEIKRGNIYYLNLFFEERSEYEKKFLSINNDKINYAITKLKDAVFKEKKKLEAKSLGLLILGSLFLFFVIFLEIYSFRIELRKKELINILNDLNKTYNEVKSKRGISDELYKEFLKLLAKKSNVNDYFKNLYITGKDNLQIERLYYSEGSFTISGYCQDDSKLEDFFRKTKYWKDINFSFSRKNNQIIFNISGKFTNE